MIWSAIGRGGGRWSVFIVRWCDVMMWRGDIAIQRVHVVVAPSAPVNHVLLPRYVLANSLCILVPTEQSTRYI